LINSNPATIMTDPSTADHVYLLPLNRKSIIQILKEQPTIDAVLPTMGGQTALNLAMECDKAGIWDKYGVKTIGVDFKGIERAEDREIFRQLMIEIGVDVPRARTAKSFLQGKEIAQEIGFPLVLRPSYTLGGTGGGFVHDPAKFDQALTHALHSSPIHEVLIEESIWGWKEFELEVLRDYAGNHIVICSIENLDPMGIHTGDSITVAPAMTLPDTQMQHMRNVAFKVMDAIGEFCGGCNVQFSIDPDTGRMIVIEINPRVSRSSALASKATGYPIAKIAAKLAVGYRLDELKNQITGTTSAFFEPTLDYVIVKIPRWNFDKFRGSDRTLGLQMKSVGEVMGIGRSFTEALQKACQSLESKRNGLGADGKELTDLDEIMHSLEHPSSDRIFHVKDAMQLGLPLRRIHKATKIDMWFLEEIYRLVKIDKEIATHTIESLPKALLVEAKRNGYADRQIAHLLNCLESQVYQLRTDMGVQRQYKMVDTCAAEFEAQTPYFYSTFDGETESHRSDKKKVVIFGSGPNRIGQGIEFDYCCVHGVMAAKEAGYETIMINCNPETVSTDFNVSDKLYFEPVFWEHVYDIIKHENPEQVIVQLGGQTALKLAEKLDRYGIRIAGTSYLSLDIAEDRGQFSTLLKNLDIPYPEFGVAENANDALRVIKTVGYPALVRPSYVLGGQSMRIVINDEELEEHVINTLKDIPGNKVLIDHFLDGAIEAEVDAICDGESVQVVGMMEHIEPAGIHSGDSNAVLPPFSLGPLQQTMMENYTKRIALALGVKGLINVQFAVQKDKVFVIEANPRASRTVPFIAKAHGIPYVNYATKVMLGTHKLSDFTFEPKLVGFAIKEPVFSFNKFPNVNKELGPEMKSTGESIYFIEDLNDEHFLKLYQERNMYLSR
jgi:carbamoyl-phosphate synthase large subunit